LLAHAEDVLADVQSQGRELTGQLVVGCFRTAAPFVLPGLLETFAAEHPRVRLDFIEGPLPDLERALRDGRCEVAIVYDLDVGPGIECEALYQTEPYVLLAPDHPLASRGDPLEPRELADHDLVMLDVPPSNAYFTSIFVNAGLVPRVRFKVSSYELLRSLVARNLGYGLLISRPHADVSYEGRPLEARRLAGPTLSINVSLAWAARSGRTRVLPGPWETPCKSTHIARWGRFRGIEMCRHVSGAHAGSASPCSTSSSCSEPRNGSSARPRSRSRTPSSRAS
jgi:DNA-binding transcriptional LysR family regulator